MLSDKNQKVLNSTEAITSARVVRAVDHSPLSEVLIYPTTNQSSHLQSNPDKKKFVARVLTRAESIAMLEEKRQKKEAEIEEKKQKNLKES